jgi:hypothetical protein
VSRLTPARLPQDFVGLRSAASERPHCLLQTDELGEAEVSSSTVDVVVGSSAEKRRSRNQDYRLPVAGFRT